MFIPSSIKWYFIKSMVLIHLKYELLLILLKNNDVLLFHVSPECPDTGIKKKPLLELVVN